MSDFDETQATNAVAVSSAQSALESLSQGKTRVFSTLADETFADKRKIVSYVTNAKKIDSDDPKETMIGKPFKLTNFIVQLVDVTDRETGRTVEQNRVILVTDKDEAYYAISSGIMGSLEVITGSFGHPSTWEEALPVQVNRGRSSRGFTFFELVVL